MSDYYFIRYENGYTAPEVQTLIDRGWLVPETEPLFQRNVPVGVPLDKVIALLRVAIARGEALGYADDDYREWLTELGADDECGFRWHRSDCDLG